jgi:hypothetical protein
VSAACAPLITHPHRPMDTTAALAELAAAEAALFRLRCHLNSIDAAAARMQRQTAACRRTAADALALLDEATD